MDHHYLQLAYILVSHKCETQESRTQSFSYTNLALGNVRTTPDYTTKTDYGQR